MLAPHERRLLIGIALVLLTGAVTDWLALHRPRTIAWLVGPERVAALRPTEAVAETTSAKNSSRVKKPTAHRSAAYDEQGRLDLNAADSAAIVDLPGVGPALAGRILAERRKRGRFTKAEDLLDVRGIGPKTLARLLPHLTVRARNDSTSAAKDSTTTRR